MSKKSAALYSSFVIDGRQQEYTPAQLLDAEMMVPPVRSSNLPAEAVIVDETADPIIKSAKLDASYIEEYLERVLNTKKVAPLIGIDSYTRANIETALIDSIWNQGHFKIGDLLVEARWTWNEVPVGAMAAFYESVQAAADFLDALGLKFNKYSYRSAKDESAVTFIPSVFQPNEVEDVFFIAEPYRSEKPVLSKRRAVPSKVQSELQTWLIFIPFDSSDFRLGASLLSQIYRLGGVAPEISDADYFIDCYEVVRELVEDGIVIAGATVGEGGLLRTIKEMMAEDVGIELDISDVMHSSQEKDVLNILFSEIPGAVLQIRDSDFDYLDAELLLQDVAYFPLGHPHKHNSKIEIKASEKSGIQTILESLMQNAEGED